MKLYQLIRKFEPEKEEVVTADLTAEKVEALLTGRGLGRKRIQWMLAEFKLEKDRVTRRLQKNGIKPDFDATFHEIADQYNVNPMDVVKVILVKGYRMH